MTGQTYKLVNLTAHKVELLVQKNGQPHRILVMPSGIVARCEEVKTYLGAIGVEGEQGVVPVYRFDYGRISDLPDPAPGTLYIVSGQVRRQLEKERTDVLAPTDFVRMGGGGIDGARALENM